VSSETEQAQAVGSIKDDTRFTSNFASVDEIAVVYRRILATGNSRATASLLRAAHVARLASTQMTLSTRHTAVIAAGLRERRLALRRVVRA
jgi:hypothetical protein